MHTVRYGERDGRLIFCPTPVEEDARERAWAGIQMLLRTNRAQPFDKTSYEQVFARLLTYESVLTSGREVLVANERPVKQPPHESGLLFDRLPTVLSEQTSDKDSSQEHAFDDAKWLNSVEQICRESQISKDKFNELVAKLRKHLFSVSKKRGTPKNSK